MDTPQPIQTVYRATHESIDLAVLLIAVGAFFNISLSIKIALSEAADARFLREVMLWVLSAIILTLIVAVYQLLAARNRVLVVSSDAILFKGVFSKREIGLHTTPVTVDLDGQCVTVSSESKSIVIDLRLFECYERETIVRHLRSICNLRTEKMKTADEK